ncbi:MAG: ATP-binding protein [Actinomycetota bacterium]|nr:ATP-binding protein [Actinomycetota bacterium]
MSLFRRLSTRLLLANLLVLAVGAASFVVTFRVLASEVFDRRLRGLGRGGPPSTRSGNGQTLVETFQSSVDVALLVSLAIGVLAAGFVAWFVSRRMVEPVTRIRDTTRSMARGHYDERVEVPAVEELAALATDVNELALTLDETETRRAQLISDVTHELRTPLTSIDGYVEGAMDGVFSTEEMYGAVTDETRRLRRLVEDLAVLSRAQEGSLQFKLEEVDLGAIAARSSERLRPQFESMGVELDVEPSGEVPIRGDEERLGQVVTNLVGNALGHSQPGGRVRVTGGGDGHWGWVTIEDDGDGISAEDLPHVFDRFFRSAGGRRRAGSGLGLAVSRGLVEAHDGELIAASDGPGRGASFTLRLPVI